MVDCFGEVDGNLDLRKAKREFPDDIQKCTDRTKILALKAMAKRAWSTTGAYATCIPLMPDADFSTC